jgi:hypothetical protein
MPVHGGLTMKNIVTYFLKKIYAFLSAAQDIAGCIIIQKVSFFVGTAPNKSKQYFLLQDRRQQKCRLFQHSCLFLFRRECKPDHENFNQSSKRT